MRLGASQYRQWTMLPRANCGSTTGTVTLEAYMKAQYLKADGTTTGTEDDYTVALGSLGYGLNTFPNGKGVAPAARAAST